MKALTVSVLAVAFLLNHAVGGAYGIRTRESVPIGPFVGVADNEIGLTEWGAAQARALGIPAVRVFVWWEGQAEPSAEDLALVRGAQATGARVFVTVTGQVNPGAGVVVGGPTTPAQRATYAGFVRSLARQTGIRDVMVWNEPNFYGFWRAKPNPVAYGKLLAAAYDALRPLGVRVWAFSTSRTRGVSAMIEGVARWYRTSGRKAPLFDGVSHHPYPLPGEPWDARHVGGQYLVGDTDRLLALLDRSFGGNPRFPVVYGELGLATDGDATYVARVSVAEQARALAGIRDYLARFPRVIGIFNFELRDSDAFRTGLFDARGNAKPAALQLFPGRPVFAPAPAQAPAGPVPIVGL